MKGRVGLQHEMVVEFDPGLFLHSVDALTFGLCTMYMDPFKICNSLQ